MSSAIIVLVIILLPSLASAAQTDALRETVIVHLGDSITSTIYLEPEEKIDIVLQGLLESAYPAVRFININLGLDGEWVEAFLQNRYDSVLRDSVERADIFIVRYGTNDAQHEKSPGGFTQDLKALVTRLRTDYHGCSIILGTGPHIRDLPWCNTDQYGHHWQAIRDLGQSDGWPVVDIFRRFEEEHGKEGVVLGKNDSGTDIHPNAQGVIRTAEELMKVLPEELRGVRR
jgi:lysophospholipase L1-like esterase